MTLWILAVLAGLAGLVWASDRFVFGASALATTLGVPPLVVGLVIVGIGTSAPELVVSGLASLDGRPGLAVGNALGSNIANVGLVAGATALVMPIAVRSATLRKEFPVMFAVVGLFWLLVWDERLGRFEGVVLLALFVALTVVMMTLALRARGDDPLGEKLDGQLPRNVSLAGAAGWTAAGLLALLVSSRAVVWGAEEIAHALEVSDLVIGLTVVAVGTSLPELAVSVTSALKGEVEIAIGNVLGSNMFNLLPVMAMPALIAPGPLPAEVLGRDLPVMTVFTVALLLTAWGLRGRGRVERWEGALLLVAFAGYQLAVYRGAVA